jgi:hypothetical protein
MRLGSRVDAFNVMTVVCSVKLSMHVWHKSQYNISDNNDVFLHATNAEARHAGSGSRVVLLVGMSRLAM